MNKNDYCRVLVWGANHHNTLGLIRSLGQAGLRPHVILTCKQKNKLFVLKSKYITQSYRFDSYEESLQFIIDNYYSPQSKTIVFCTSDNAASMLDCNLDAISGGLIVMNCVEKGALTKLQDKNTISDLAQSVGLTIPKKWVVNKDSFLNNIIFPCITKPLESHLGVKKDIQIFYDLKKLEEFLKGNDHCDSFLINEYIEKDFEWQLIGLSLNAGEQIVIPGYTRIIRSKSTSNTGFLEYYPIEYLEFDYQRCKDLIQKSRYSGIFSMEFLRGIDGRDYFLEINFRNDGNAFSVTAAGMNLYKIWIDYNLGIDYSNEITKEVHHIVVLPELWELNRVLANEITWNEWIMDFKKADVFLYFDKKDMKPFFSKLSEVIVDFTTSYIKRVKRKIIRVLKK